MRGISSIIEFALRFCKRVIFYFWNGDGPFIFFDFLFLVHWILTSVFDRLTLVNLDHWLSSRWDNQFVLQGARIVEKLVWLSIWYWRGWRRKKNRRILWRGRLFLDCKFLRLRVDKARGVWYFEGFFKFCINNQLQSKSIAILLVFTCIIYINLIIKYYPYNNYGKPPIILSDKVQNHLHWYQERDQRHNFPGGYWRYHPQAFE